MQKRILGKSGLEVSALGLGCMGMSFAYGPADEAESLRVLHRYTELGGNFLDTAEIYGPFKNEELLGKFFREVPRERVVVASKFGFRIDPDGTRRGLDSSPANVRRACADARSTACTPSLEASSSIGRYSRTEKVAASETSVKKAFRPP